MNINERVFAKITFDVTRSPLPKKKKKSKLTNRVYLCILTCTNSMKNGRD